MTDSVSAAENPPKHCALGHCIGEKTVVAYVAAWAKGAAVQRGLKGGLHVSVYLFECLKHWNFDNHFCLAILKPIFVNVLIVVVAILR